MIITTLKLTPEVVVFEAQNSALRKNVLNDLLYCAICAGYKTADMFEMFG